MLTPISFLNFVPNPRVLSCYSVIVVLFFVRGVSVSQIIFERDASGDTGVGISTGESIVDILGICIDNELSGVEGEWFFWIVYFYKQLFLPAASLSLLVNYPLFLYKELFQFLLLVQF